MEKGNGWIVLILFIVLIMVALGRFGRWLEKPPKRRLPVPAAGDIPQTDVVELLEGAGFDVLAGKTKLPITIAVNGEATLASQLYIDYLAAREEKLYVVRLARERVPIDWAAGSSVREKLLPYSLIYPETEGVLYVDMEQRKIKIITFQIEV
ncbi:hypothetical protein B5M42_017990 [Paenibacillus athensensis]|uniref:Uncharacterized protein n=1 Tax=Paenibacillus athensensis TaxID=1967502 RepID=A0A4Y8Q1E0_9BACL|nr:hypothetical protein [Paenibacillus athensensis]MCD1260695.1 hypothetical protein [Paenibacillus athensensis]